MKSAREILLHIESKLDSTFFGGHDNRKMVKEELLSWLEDWEKDIREDQQTKDNERCVAILNQARYSGITDLRSLIARIQDASWNWEEKEDE